MAHDKTKRERLVKAVLPVALQYGFTNFTIKNLSDYTNIPLGNIHYYLKKKSTAQELALLRLRKDKSFHAMLNNMGELNDEQLRVLRLIAEAVLEGFDVSPIVEEEVEDVHTI